MNLPQTQCKLSKKTRHENRLCAVQFLHMWSINPSESVSDSLFYFFKMMDHPREYYVFGESLIQGVLQYLPSVDDKIKLWAKNWEFSRINKIDLAILRLAIYELLYRLDIPPIVSINEAIDLSKELSTSDSKRFINGILDKVKEGLDRPLRKAQTD